MASVARLGLRHLSRRSSVRPFGLAGKAFSSESVKGIETKVSHYYDDPNSVNFHDQVWGGDIHIGRYDLLEGKDAELEGTARIERAAELTTETLFKSVFPANGPPPSECTVMDMGAGRGKTARMAAKVFGCKVVCIDLAPTFNAMNAKISAAEGLSDKIIIPGERSFFDTEMPEGSMDAVISQDCFLHATENHHRCVKEAARVLKPGGLFVFTDMMQSDTADKAKLAEIYKQYDVTDLASPYGYFKWGAENGLELLKFEANTPMFSMHYVELVAALKAAKFNTNIKGIEDSWFDRMLDRYSTWVLAADSDLFRWGTFVFKKPE